MKTYKSILLTEDTYNKLKQLKSMQETESQKANFNSIINRLVSAEYVIAVLDKDLKNYLLRFIEKTKEFKEVLGVALFGSVARGTYHKYSDIDLFIVISNKTPAIVERLYSVRSELHEYEDMFLKKDLYLYVSPVIVDVEELNKFRPLYLDIAREGIILFEKEEVLSDFFKKMNRIKSSYEFIEGIRVMKWKKIE